MTRAGLLIVVALLAPCRSVLAQIEGLSEGTNKALAEFLKRQKETAGRKVAVFDLDGTLIGQVPFYAADEFFTVAVQPSGRVARSDP